MLEAHGLYCRRQQRVLFDDLDLCVSAGQVLQITGPNGSGKSTLLRIIAGLYSGFSGAVEFRDKPLAADLQGFRARAVYLGHGTGLKQVLSPLENMQWRLALRGITASAKNCRRALADAGLGGFETTPCHSLSAGQQRRVNLACLFPDPAKLWLLDEPLTALDADGSALLNAALAAHAARGGAALVATHQRLDASLRCAELALGGGRAINASDWER